MSAIPASTARIHTYLNRAALEDWRDLTPSIERNITALIAALGNLTTRLSEETLYTYQIPLLSDDGSCSIIDELAPVPYDLTVILGGRGDDTTRKLVLLNQVVEHATQLTGTDWLGIYQARPNHQHAPVLVKLAYRGRPSRAEFPLTPAFAQGSTNSTVGLSGRAKVIDDVAAYTAGGEGFYVCDAEVQSELCVPLFNEVGDVIGIIDAEAAPKQFFNEERRAVIAALALVAPALLPSL